MYLACFARLAAKAAKTAKLFNAVQKARVSWGRIKPLLSQAQTPAELPPVPPAQLTLTHLSFAYPGGEEILRDVSCPATHPYHVLIRRFESGLKSTAAWCPEASG